MTPEAKKIWDSKAGGNLMAAMMGEKPLTEEDRKTLEALKKSGSNLKTQTAIKQTAKAMKSRTDAQQ